MFTAAGPMDRECPPADTSTLEHDEHAVPHDTGSPAMLLIVDDEAVIRDTLAELMDLEGYRTAVAADANHALRILHDRRVDVLITDLSMPSADGLSLIRQARVLQPDLPAILLTGYAEEPSMLSATPCGTFHVLRKPVQLRCLLTHIAEALAQR